MKKSLLTIICLSLFTASCSAFVDVNALKAQLRDELKNETSSSLPEDTIKGVKDALEALYTLQSIVRSGISYSAYPAKIAELHIVIDKMKRQTKYDLHPSSVYIESATQEYDHAQSIWACAFGPLNKATISNTDFLMGQCESNYENILTTLYGVKVDTLPSSGTKVIYVPDALSAIWGEASKQIKLAQDNLNNAPLEKPAPIPTQNPVPFVTSSPTPVPTSLSTATPSYTPTPAPAIVSIGASTGFISLPVGKNTQISGISAKYSNGSYGLIKDLLNVSFSSENSGVASVGYDGTIIAKHIGVTFIVITYQGVSARIQIEVTEAST